VRPKKRGDKGARRRQAARRSRIDHDIIVKETSGNHPTSLKQYPKCVRK